MAKLGPKNSGIIAKESNSLPFLSVNRKSIEREGIPFNFEASTLCECIIPLGIIETPVDLFKSSAISRI
jgi:hypothetical protein